MPVETDTIKKLRSGTRRSPHFLSLLAIATSVIGLGAIGCTQKLSVEAHANTRGSTELLKSSTDQLDASANVRALVSFGPRVTGTRAINQAGTYLISEYQKAGYVTEVQTFTYSKFLDEGSNLTIEETKIDGRALNGSPSGNPTAPMVAVPNFGRTDDFAAVEVEGAIAIVKRGEIRFLQKAKNAAAAGAVGLIIVNHEDDNFLGTLGGETDIPVFALAGKEGQPLLERVAAEEVEAILTVNTSQRQVTGRNIIARKPGVRRPKVLLGAHYDSVSGSPGANDNASGTAVVLDLARKLSNSPLASQAWFVAFDGEEDGLHGSRAFVETADSEFLAELEGMLNFDMVGINEKLRAAGTPSLTALVEQSDNSVSAFGSRVGSDHVPFAQTKVPVLFFTRGLDPNYHSPKDTTINPQLLEATTQVGLKVIEQMLTE